MAPGTIRSLEDLPLHLVADILAQLNTIEQLKSAVLSHRIFRDAFRESAHSIAQSVVLNQVPREELPFSLALLASTRAAANDHDAVPRLMMGLEQHMQNEGRALTTLADLSLSDYDFLSRTHVAVQSLGDMYCRETLPLFSQWFGSEEGRPLQAAASDYFRIHRALYRYQILCNLFCNPRNPRTTDREVLMKEEELVLLSFAPWVNEQLLCVYHFLQRAVIRGALPKKTNTHVPENELQGSNQLTTNAVYDELAAHDISWGALSVSWSNEIWWTRAGEASRIGGFLRHGLEFLSSVLRAETFDEKARLLKDSKSYDAAWLNAVDVSDNMTISQLHEAGMLKRVAGPLDGDDGSTTSGPFRTWLATHKGVPISLSVLDFDKDGNLWACGYVIWDALDRMPLERLLEKVAAVRQVTHLFQRYRRLWSDEQVSQSKGMRADLSSAGAHGYWPLDGIDFVGVRGLDEDGKRRILRRWRDGTADYPPVVLSEQTLEILRSMDLDEDGTL